MANTTVRIANVRCVFRDAEHNAFTDLCRFRGAYYLTFRSCPDGHGISPRARIRVLRSADGTDWQQVTEFSVPERDTRDPHFLILRERLFVYSGTWLCPAGHKEFDINEHLGYGVWSDDGETWHGPRMLEGTYGHYVWRAAAFADRAYLCARRKRDFVCTASKGEGGAMTEAAMLESDDGLIWRYRACFVDAWGDETAFVFGPAGEITALARRLGNLPSAVCRSLPPYTAWERHELDRPVGGPMLAWWGDRLLVGGRKTLGAPVTALYWLRGNRLAEIGELPSGGDTSYTGFVQTDTGQGLLSYYSSHGAGEGSQPAAIYLADLALVP
jgi:hypothetical protein